LFDITPWEEGKWEDLMEGYSLTIDRLLGSNC
jgi:hypothetical protein